MTPLSDLLAKIQKELQDKKSRIKQLERENNEKQKQIAYSTDKKSSSIRNIVEEDHLRVKRQSSIKQKQHSITLQSLRESEMNQMAIELKNMKVRYENLDEKHRNSVL